MKKETPLQIKKQSAAKHFTAIIAKKKYVVEADANLKETLTKQIDAYNKKNSEAKLKAIFKLLTPKEEKAKTELIVAKKKLKHDKKEVKQELAQAEKSDEKLITALKEIDNLKKSNEEKSKKLQDQDQELVNLKKAKEVEVAKPVASHAAPHRRSGEY